MRLLNTSTLGFEEFYDGQVPAYAILSHRWGRVDQEVSYGDYVAGRKRNTAGFDKIVNFCKLARGRGFAYGWIDSCCIDKTSSAELSEAINSMYDWYERANICCAYISDADSLDDLAGSEWFRRGWTLQELVAPSVVFFFNRHWHALGSKYSLRDIIAQPSGVDEGLLAGSTRLEDYSTAQIMSWASHRKTSRIEDEAYCLLGLFNVNMPLLYGERREAFRRLQELIMARSDDCSLFAWGLGNDGSEQGLLQPDASLLAPFPRQFQHSRDVQKGFATQRISFELTNRGMMVLIHRSYNPDVLDQLLRYASDHLDEEIEPLLGLTLPFGCFIRRSNGKEGFWKGCFARHEFGRRDSCSAVPESFILQLQLERGKWRRIGVASYVDDTSWAEYTGSHYFAYANDYVRIYVHHDRWSEIAPERALEPAIEWLHVQDQTDYRYGMPQRSEVQSS